MKKTAAVLIMLAALLFVSNGVAQVQLGLQAGANFADVKLDPMPEDVETSTRTGFLIGGILFYSFSPILGLQIEPAYVQKGAKVDNSFTEDGDDIELERTLNASYIDIPVLLKASFGNGPIKPYLVAGATVSFELDSKFEVDKATVNGVDVTNQIPSEDLADLEKIEVKSTDFILTFGGGVIIPLGQLNIFLEGQYNLGLTDVNDETPEPGDVEPEIKTTGIQIKAGVMFPLN